MQLQMEAATAAFQESNEVARALAEARDPQAIMALRTRLAESNTQRMLDYTRQIYDAAMQARNEMMGMMEKSVSGMGADLPAQAMKVFADLPFFNKMGGLDPMQALVAAGNTLMENMSKVSEIATGLTQAGMKAAGGLMEQTMQGGTQAAKMAKAAAEAAPAMAKMAQAAAGTKKPAAKPAAKKK
jgi:phasin family protein